MIEYKGAVMNDTELLDWAEKNPGLVIDNILGWWAACGLGAREDFFNFRKVIEEVMKKSKG